MPDNGSPAADALSSGRSFPEASAGFNALLSGRSFPAVPAGFDALPSEQSFPAAAMLPPGYAPLWFGSSVF